MPRAQVSHIDVDAIQLIAKGRSKKAAVAVTGPIGKRVRPRSEPDVVVSSAPLSSSRGSTTSEAASGVVGWVPICARCNKRVLHTDDAERSAQCYTCKRFYHVACYLSDIGWEKSDRAHAALRGHKCSACLSGVYRLPWFVPDEKLQPATIASFPRSWYRHRSKFAPESLAAALTLLHQGFVVLPLSSSTTTTTTSGRGASSAKTVVDENIRQQLTDLRDHLTKYFDGLRHSYERLVSNAAATAGSVVSLSTGFQNFRMRCEGRYEILSPRVGAVLYPLVTESRLVKEVVQIALNCDNPRRMSDGCFFSQAGSDGQNLHTDGPPLLNRLDSTVPPSDENSLDNENESPRPAQRRRKEVDDDDETNLLPGNEQLYPYAINCFVPLVDVTASNGTEFYPESHLLPDLHPQQSAPSIKPHKIAPAIPVGHVLLFDYRVTHRGLPNKCGSDRPCAYITFSQRWYNDTYNFGAQRYGTKPLEVEQAFLESREERYQRRRGGE
ncbi:ADP-ribosylation factor 3a, putative [Bodo saltans]|uniref:ADP-ribosylation factor 3a, putative n=1 Tax=Bodo saltans TaxID=75058 RepID=A0A0S4IX88_BODSA|nr:ADP-ribosylation factor 3a, putative [Bodo saltans]|eukprot:CUG06256.1 ADP-ribosylation factor 3a, putative [Bodo saltans]